MCEYLNIFSNTFNKKKVSSESLSQYFGHIEWKTRRGNFIVLVYTFLFVIRIIVICLLFIFNFQCKQQSPTSYTCIHHCCRTENSQQQNIRDETMNHNCVIRSKRGKIVASNFLRSLFVICDEISPNPHPLSHFTLQFILLAI